MHGGATFFQRALSAHPKLHAPHNYATDDALNALKLIAFRDEQLKAGKAASGGITGLVLHEHGSWSTRGNGPPTPETVRQLAEVTETRRFVRVVREPLSYAVSLLRHRVCERFSWSFESLGLPWIKGFELETGRAVLTQNVRGGVPVFPGLDGVFDADLPFFTANLSYQSTGYTFAEHFPQAKLYDLSEFAPSKGNSALIDLFSFLGVDADFSHPMHTSRQHGQAHMFMYGNRVSLSVFGHHLVARLGHDGEADFEERPGMGLVELASLPASDGCRKAGLNVDRLTLLGIKSQWNQIPDDVKARVIENGAMENLLGQVLMDLFAANYQAISKAMDGLPAAAMTQDRRTRIWQAVGDELLAFAGDNPRIQSLWTEQGNDPEKAFKRPRAGAPKGPKTPTSGT